MASSSLFILAFLPILWSSGLTKQSSELVHNGHSMQQENIGNESQGTNYAAGNESGVPPILKLSDIFIDERGYHSIKEKISVDLGYETLWRNGSITFTAIHQAGSTDVGMKIGSQDKLELAGTISGEPEDVLSTAEDKRIDEVFHTGKKSAGVKRRMRRLIFSPDDRIKLNTSTTAQRFPFSAVAKTSTGCTATFISPQHVLTSAHCVHNGTQYLVSTSSSLKIGFLRRKGRFKWIPAQSIMIAKQWKQKKSVPFDYAVIKLRKAHKRQFLTLGVLPTHKRLKIHFASFPGDKQGNSLWYTRCNARILSQVMISRCDAFTGSSGSGVYVRVRSRKSDDLRVLVGVLSGSGKVRLPDGRLQPFNFATKLTNLQAQDICQMIKRDYFECISWRPKDAKHTIKRGRKTRRKT